MIKLSVVTHSQGSWRWTRRYALVAYAPAVLRTDCKAGRAGELVWRTQEVRDHRVTPTYARQLQADGVAYGSLHNTPLSSGELARYQWGETIRDLVK